MHLVAQLYVKNLYCFVSITLFLTVFKNINSVQYKTKITSLYFEWPWFISRLIYVTHYMYINWRRKKNNWVIFCRPITLNLPPTVHYKVKIPSRSPGYARIMLINGDREPFQNISICYRRTALYTDILQFR